MTLALALLAPAATLMRRCLDTEQNAMHASGCGRGRSVNHPPEGYDDGEPGGGPRNE